MTAGLVRDARHYYRWEDGPKCPGVTTVIKTLDKSPQMIGWASRETAAAAVRNIELLSGHMAHRTAEALCPLCMASGPDWKGPAEPAVRWLKGMPGRERDKSADLGTRIHSLADAHARKQPIVVSADEAPFLESYLRWLKDKRPQILNVEYMVYSQTYRYGGTADVAYLMDGELVSADYKTGKDAYPETALQLAGLNGADWAGKPGDPKKYAIPKATRFGVLWIRPEGAEFIPYQVGPEEFGAFLACRRLLDWQQERAPIVKGEVQLVQAA